MPRSARVEASQGRYTFKAHGLSSALKRQQNAQKYLAFAQSIAQMAPQLLPLIDMPKFLLRAFEAQHFPNPEELLPPNVREIFERMQMGMVDQQDPKVQAQLQTQNDQNKQQGQGDQNAIQELLKTALLHAQPAQGATQ
jgi:hypothetical protein